MNSKERVHAALRHEPVDRTPIWMWFHPETATRLGEYLEIPPGKVIDAMGDDIRQAWVSNNYAMEGIVHDDEGESHIDAWGIEWVKYGAFNQIRRSPLADATDEEVRAYSYPFDQVDGLLGNMLPVVDQSEEFFIGCDVSPCAFEMVCRVRGMEQATLDIAESPGLAASMLANAGQFSLHLVETACNLFRLDWLWTGDDVGGQNGMIISPRAWRSMIRPHLEHIFQVGKSRKLWVAFHSCGAIRPIIPDLIEIGMDVLNPIQCNCPGMNPIELKKEFGKSITLMGGVDTQDLLPNGSAGEVLGATLALLEGLDATQGGYILAASHAIPPETPSENIFAMYQAAGVTPQEIFDRASELRKRT